MNIEYIERGQALDYIKQKLLKTDIILDIGCGIQPQTYVKPLIHICCDPFYQYIDKLKVVTDDKYDRLFLFINADWRKVMETIPPKSVDSIFILDVIEHLQKEEGLQLLKLTEKVARKQIVVFTPLGFLPQKHSGTTDAWGLGGTAWQEHKSGWLPRDFDSTWNIYICKDFHINDNLGKLFPTPYGALWAIKNLISHEEDRHESALRGITSSFDCSQTDFSTSIIQKYALLRNAHDDLQQEHDDLQQEHTQLKQRHVDLLNSKAVRFACKLSDRPILLKIARICYSTLRKFHLTYLFCRRSICRIAFFGRSFTCKLEDSFIINKGKINNQFNPKVSIVIPVYNGSNYVREAIDSALAQTYKNIEIIVVNDGSTDNTEEIVKQYGDKLRYFKKENGGVSTALNLAIEKSEGEYISWLSHDDVYYPNKISEQIRCLNKNNNKDLILYSNVEYIDKKSNSISRTAYEDTHTLDHLNSGLYALTEGITNGCALLIPKICFNKVGMFDEKLLTSSDYDMWFRLFKLYGIRFIPKVLIKYRLHSQSGTNTSSVYNKEANKTWIKILDGLSAKDISKIEDSPFVFYSKMANQMKASSFYEAYNFALNLAKNITQNA